ncbi:hypothetical protein VFPPC_16802 [Pochonia chlamydosporia 170]|uniref:Uncharacterized protein n=1 Tax=Pochonia chlamydosporia 170 TaxID=1380566 RepID=A0A179F3Q7_METCM|nr:hypothetical protein VFPPC_16802 [Pochonia chlamydosporia 170]OAQ59823.1 hypothetical protein VFPPC_16802 [Pochonia chlamydosporia 170]
MTPEVLAKLTGNPERTGRLEPSARTRLGSKRLETNWLVDSELSSSCPKAQQSHRTRAFLKHRSERYEKITNLEALVQSLRQCITRTNKFRQFISHDFPHVPCQPGQPGRVWLLHIRGFLLGSS